MTKIKQIKAREILDSRGNPTVKTEIELKSGIKGLGSVPSGASTGKFEALELRDEDKDRYQGKGVKQAVKNVNGPIAKELIGREPYDLKKLDWLMRELDGTDNKSRLGANAILSVSLALARAGAKDKDRPLYEYINQSYELKTEFKLPRPMFNILNGGQHAQNKLSVQEFMFVPKLEDSFASSLRMGAEVYHQLKDILNKKGFATGVGDEGGFAPEIDNPKQALEFIVQAAKEAGYQPEDDYQIALDVAASEFSSRQEDGFVYKMEGFDRLNSKGLINYLLQLTDDFPIYSIEDPLDQEDWVGWQEMIKKADDKIQIVGDDLFVTNSKRLKKGIEMKAANSILIKLNQIGTLSETIEAINLAKEKNYSTIISHRSGETTDSFISDLAVGVGSSQIKSGSLARGERVVKYNRLLKIESKLNQ